MTKVLKRSEDDALSNPSLIVLERSEEDTSSKQSKRMTNADRQREARRWTKAKQDDAIGPQVKRRGCIVDKTDCPRAQQRGHIIESKRDDDRPRRSEARQWTNLKWSKEDASSSKWSKTMTNGCQQDALLGNWSGARWRISGSMGWAEAVAGENEQWSVCGRGMPFLAI